jgi:branched-chain amino acid transport system substrate-binding protein
MRRYLISAFATCAAVVFAAGTATAQDTVKLGFVLPMTGQLTSVGKQVTAGAQLYIQQHGNSVAGKKIELLMRDDGGVPDVAKRVAQELLVNEKVAILGGGLTPSALAMAPLATEAKVPEVVVISGTSIVTERSPYIVRVSFTLGQSSGILGDWAAKNGSKKAVVIQSDWAPGAEATAVFTDRFKKGGGEVLDIIKVPLANPDFSPFLQHARDLSPDTLFVFVPAGQAGTFAKQFVERGLDKSGIKLIGPGDITDDDDLPHMGDQMIGTITALNYSASHNSAMNKAYVAAFKKANNGMRPNFISVGGYDGMHLIYEALKKTNGSTNGAKLIEAMKGLAWESPRGPMSIDPETRDVVQNIYLRKVEKIQGELYNSEFATFEAVKDPIKEAKKVAN